MDSSLLLLAIVQGSQSLSSQNDWKSCPFKISDLIALTRGENKYKECQTRLNPKNEEKNCAISMYSNI
jgi:hypothetical protein